MSRASASSSSSSNYSICLICGSHTDLVLNIFEPRCGPNIVDIIFAKFKFKAEKNSSDKFICYDCNNWLINWFSLQNVNETNEPSSEQSDSGKNANLRKPMEKIHSNPLSNCYDCYDDDGDDVLRSKEKHQLNFEYNYRRYDVPDYNNDKLINLYDGDSLVECFDSKQKYRSCIDKKLSMKKLKYYRRNKYKERQRCFVKKDYKSCFLCKFPSVHHQIIKKYKNLIKIKILKEKKFNQLYKLNKRILIESKKVSKQRKTIDSSSTSLSSSSSSGTSLSSCNQQNVPINKIIEIKNEKREDDDTRMLVNSRNVNHQSKDSSLSSKYFDDSLLKMLQTQGTILFSEEDVNDMKLKKIKKEKNQDSENKIENRKNDDIIINFNTTITEVLPPKFNQQNQNLLIIDSKFDIPKIPKSLSISITKGKKIDKRSSPSSSLSSNLLINPFWRPNKTDNLVSIVID